MSFIFYTDAMLKLLLVIKIKIIIIKTTNFFYKVQIFAVVCGIIMTHCRSHLTKIFKNLTLK